MTAKSKLAEARFFLDKISETDQGSAAFRYNVSACGSALYSSTQHLLYDYAKKFWPSLTQEDYIDAYHVALLARATRNETASEFVDWYNKLEGRIKSNPDANAALQARRAETHRTSPALLCERALNEVVSVADQFEYGILTTQGDFKPTGSAPPTTEQLRAVQGSTTAVFFVSYRAKQVSETLSSTIDFIESIINEAESTFGPP